jgi:predicted secreted protein
MASLLRSTRSIFRAPTPLITTTSRRTFLTTPTLRIKEDADRTPEQLEAAKQDQLREQKEGKGRWREDLASHGESNIAADKEKVHDHDAHMKELQQQGKEKSEKGDL